MLRLSVLAGVLAVLCGCTTVADVTLPDGTHVHVWDNKSREGVVLNWSKTPDGYAVLLTSQRSGSDPAVALITAEITKTLSKAIDKVPAPTP